MDTLEKAVASYRYLFEEAVEMFRGTSTSDVHFHLRDFLLYTPVVPVLITFHALFAALSIYKLSQGKQFWLKSLVLTTFAAFGGSTLSAVFSGQPAPLFTTSSNVMLGYITIAWYIVNHTPIRPILQFRPITAIIAFGAMAAKARSIFAFIDKFAVRFPGAAAGAIVLGGLAGSGGSLFVSIEKVVMHGFSASSELSAPGWGLKSAYIAASLYYMATDPDHVLRGLPVSLKYAIHRDEARYWISLALCTHAAMETLYGRHLNPVWPLEEIFFALTRVTKETVVEETPDEKVDTAVGEKVKEAWADGAPSGIRRRKRKGEAKAE